MNKKYIIKESSIFDNVIQTGNKIGNNIYTIFYKKSDNNISKYGFAIGKKNGNAVNRNLIKRQIKSIIIKNKLLFSNGYYYIIMVKKCFSNTEYKIKEQALIELIEKVNKCQN